MEKIPAYSCGRIRFGVIGSGWRSEFYLRIAAAVPELFELTGVLVRNEEKKEYLEKKYHVRAYRDFHAFLKESPHFVVVAISKPDIGNMLLDLMKRGIPVLSETPPAIEEGLLSVLWKTKNEYDARILVAEQYCLYPMIQAKRKAVELGLLEKPYNVTTSYAHDYHGMSLIRTFLGTGFQNAVLYGDTFEYPVMETVDRRGMREDHDTIMRPWFRSTILFEDGKTAFYDFSPVLYQSFLRKRHFSVMSRNGQIEDDMISYINKSGDMAEECFRCIRDPFDDDCIRIQLGIRILYENPFPKTRMTEDEIAIAESMIHMKQYLETGDVQYSFADALQDTYMAVKMKEAAAKKGEKVVLETQLWGSSQH